MMIVDPQRGTVMSDIGFVATILVFLWVSLLYVRGADRL